MQSSKEHQSRQPQQRCRLKTLGSSRSGHEFSIHAGKAQIGRAPDASWVLPYPTVSRYHAQIEACETGWRIRDLGSTNGLAVNGENVLERRLAHGDRIRLGEVAVEVTIELANRSRTEPGKRETGSGPVHSPG